MSCVIKLLSASFIGVILDLSLAEELSEVVGSTGEMRALTIRVVNLVQTRAIRRRLECKDQAAVLLARVGNAGSFLSGPLDSHVLSIFDQPHLRPLPPPAIHLTRSRYPYARFLSQSRQVGQQLLEDAHLPGLHDIIRMNEKAH